MYSTLAHVPCTTKCPSILLTSKSIKFTERVHTGNDPEMKPFNLLGNWEHYESVICQIHPQGMTAIHSLYLVKDLVHYKNLKKPFCLEDFQLIAQCDNKQW